MESPPRAVGRPAGADGLGGGRAQLQGHGAGGQGPDLRARRGGGGGGGRGESGRRAVGRGRRQPRRRGAPSAQQVLNQETLAQMAKAGRGGAAEERGGGHHVPVRAGVGRQGAGEHGGARGPAARPPARLSSRTPGEGGEATEDAVDLRRYYLFGSGVSLKGGRSECGRGELCAFLALGVGSRGAGGRPSRFPCRSGPDFFFFFKKAGRCVQLIHSCHPAHRVTDATNNNKSSPKSRSFGKGWGRLGVEAS